MEFLKIFLENFFLLSNLIEGSWILKLLLDLIY